MFLRLGLPPPRTCNVHVPQARGTGHWRGHGADVARCKPLLAWGGAGVARACPVPPSDGGGADRGFAGAARVAWCRVCSSASLRATGPDRSVRSELEGRREIPRMDVYVSLYRPAFLRSVTISGTSSRFPVKTSYCTRAARSGRISGRSRDLGAWPAPPDEDTRNLGEHGFASAGIGVHGGLGVVQPLFGKSETRTFQRATATNINWPAKPHSRAVSSGRRCSGFKVPGHPD
eukprot:gene25429-biopygen19492